MQGSPQCKWPELDMAKHYNHKGTQCITAVQLEHFKMVRGKRGGRTMFYLLKHMLRMNPNSQCRKQIQMTP